MIAFLLVIGVSFYLVAASTIQLVGDSLFAQRVASGLQNVCELSAVLGEQFEQESADSFYQRMIQAARTGGGRLLVVDMDGKVQFDTFDERCGTRLALAEVHTLLRGERESDHGFHRLDGTQTPVEGMDDQSAWVGCFTSALFAAQRRVGALVMIVSVQDTVDSLLVMRNQMLRIFSIALVVVLILSAFISRIVTKPVKELSAGIERMSAGDYQHRVHVPGKGEMAQLAAAFNQMSEQVHNLDEARNQFVSNASHELKTPMATIKILVESMLYQDDMPGELRSEFLTDINKEIDRLSSVVSDLLTLVHIDSHKLRLRREQMIFADTVRESVKRFTPLAGKRGQELTIEISDPCEMMADPGKLAQVCYNIIENAIKYTPDGGKISVTLRRMGRDAVLEIADTGVGIPQEDVAHVFDRFYRVDKARSRDTGGTGLGLSIVQQIVRLHAGSVTVTSEQGKGTTFTVQLPVK